MSVTKTHRICFDFEVEYETEEEATVFEAGAILSKLLEETKKDLGGTIKRQLIRLGHVDSPDLDREYFYPSKDITAVETDRKL
jgi:hypothetical protein